MHEDFILMNQAHFHTGPLFDRIGSHREILHFSGQSVVTGSECLVNLLLGLQAGFEFAYPLPPAFTPP